VKLDAVAQSEVEQAKQLVQQIDKLYKQGRFAEAVPIAQKVLAIREKTLGLNILRP